MDPKDRKIALRSLTYGLYVVTARGGEKIGGGTVTWLSQASFEPPLVMVAIKRGSNLDEAVRKGFTFAVNVLAKDQKPLAERFFKPPTVAGSEISGCPFELGVTGAPLLTESPVSFECKVTDFVDRGDHAVVVGEVVDVKVRQSGREMLTLAETAWQYGG